MTRKEHVVVVDAYSGGRNLIPAFQALGFPVIHVQSAPIAYYAADDEMAAARADRHVRFEGDVDVLVRSLQEATVRLVLAGSEGAVLLADELAERLRLSFRNDFSLSVARRDKFEMQERLREAGLASIPQARVRDGAELDAWLDGREACTVVVKPLRSAATDGVHVCRSREEGHAALADILSRPDMFGQPNDFVLCQEFMAGTEYVLNGVAGDGNYLFTEGWLSSKSDDDGCPVYDAQYLFCAGDPGFDVTSRYVGDVCAALGIVNGPFHAEVMLTAAGPVLIEIGARPAGGADPYVIETCLGHSQISVLVDAALHPQAFDAAYRGQGATRQGKRAAYVYLIAREAGMVRGVDLTEFMEIPEVVRADYRYSPGERQERTRDLITAAGVVLVIADTQDKLAAAVDRIREIESRTVAAGVDLAPA